MLGLLSNQEPMSLERLHTMLTLLSSGGGSSQDIKFEMNFVDLQKFLQSMVAVEKVYYIDGLYSGLNSRLSRK